MSILVVCPGCHKSFRVSDKFAGKSGACPKCKARIDVPAKTEEVKVHAPTAFAEGGRSVSGKLITKPITRVETRLEPVKAITAGAAVLVVLIVTWGMGRAGVFGSGPVCAVGLLLVSPPLVLAAYTFLRNEELEPYRGLALYLRSTACAAGYVILWGAYAYMSAMGLMTGELWSWIFVVPPFLIVGAMVALGCLDLDFGNGFFHYAFYVLVTVLLRWTAGLGWIWEVADSAVF